MTLHEDRSNTCFALFTFRGISTASNVTWGAQIVPYLFAALLVRTWNVNFLLHVSSFIQARYRIRLVSIIRIDRGYPCNKPLICYMRYHCMPLHGFDILCNQCPIAIGHWPLIFRNISAPLHTYPTGLWLQEYGLYAKSRPNGEVFLQLEVGGFKSRWLSEKRRRTISCNRERARGEVIAPSSGASRQSLTHSLTQQGQHRNSISLMCIDRWCTLLSKYLHSLSYA